MPDQNLASDTRALEWNDLRLILAICRSESLSGAARVLGQNHSTIFRRINAIEAKTGVRFFERTPRGYVMTDAGQTAQRYAERIEGEMDALGREVLGLDMALQGRVRVTCPEGIAAEIAPRIFAGFHRLNPGVSIDLAPSLGALDLNRREAEVAIRATAKPPEGAFGRRVSDFRFAFYAAPDFVEANRGKPLAEMNWCLIDGTIHWLVPLIWKTREAAERQVVLKSGSTRVTQNAVAEGMGITMMPCYHADPDDRLVRVSATVNPFDMGLWVLTHPDLRHTARVRALMAYVVEALTAERRLFEGLKPAGGVDPLWPEPEGTNAEI